MAGSNCGEVPSLVLINLITNRGASLPNACACPLHCSDAGQIHTGSIWVAKHCLLSGIWVPVQSNPKCWFYTSVTGIRFDSLHISIKYHPTLGFLCLFISDVMEKQQQIKYCLVFLASEVF